MEKRTPENSGQTEEQEAEEIQQEEEENRKTRDGDTEDKKTEGQTAADEPESKADRTVSLEDYQQFIIQMRRSNVHFQKLCNIPSGELTMLLAVNRLLLKQTFVIPSDIGEAMKLSRPAVSRMLHNLERKGYLRMQNRQEDHRYVMIEFTQKGDDFIREETKRCCQLLERVKERMGEEDMQKFLHYYSRFCTILADEVLV